MANKVGSVQVLGTLDDGTQFVQATTVTSALELEAEVIVPAAKSGTLTTRTDDDTGELTIAGHGMLAGDLVDVFWAGGRRRAMTVGVIAGDVVPVDGGSGDVLPAEDTAITAMVPVQYDFAVVGNNVEMLAVKSPVPGFIVFVEAGPLDIANATYEIDEESGGGRTWAANLGTNPLAGKTTTKVKFSHGSDTERVMHAAAMYESS